MLPKYPWASIKQRTSVYVHSAEGQAALGPTLEYRWDAAV